MRRPTPADPTAPLDDRPECQIECKWRQKFSGYDLQRNALRMETAHMISPWRCGWNLKPDCIGGHPLDYAECNYHG